MTFTADQLESILYDDEVVWEYKHWKSKEWSPNETGENMLQDGWYELGNMRFKHNDEWHEIESVTQVGGGEGSGEYTYIVIRVGDQFFRKEGAYFSHYGTDWDGSFEEVWPTEVTETKYLPRA